MRSLPKVLRVFDVGVLSSAAMGPAYSLASTMGPMIAAAGTLAPAALGALSALMVCMAIAFAALSRVAPNAGSSYAWIRESFGAYAGAYAAWLLILSNFFATMAIAVPAGTYTLELLAPARATDPLWSALVGAVWIVVSCVLLYVGIRPTALVTLGALAFELVVIVAAAIAALFHPADIVAATTAPPVAALPIAGFVTAMTLGVWMSDGWEVSASASEEVRGDVRASGRGGLQGLLLTTAVLLFCMIAFLHLGSVRSFTEHSSDAMALVGDLLGTPAWRIAIVIAVMLSTLSTLWTTLLYLSRSVYAMGRDGVLPRRIGRLDARNEPLVALVVVGVLTLLCEILVGFSRSAADQLNLVVNGSSVFLGLLFVFSAAAAVRRFAPERGGRLLRVLVPAAGAVGLLGVIVATLATEDQVLQHYAWALLGTGIPFAFWRGRAIIRPPEQTAPASL